MPSPNYSRDGYMQLLSVGFPSLDGTRWYSGVDPSNITPAVYGQASTVMDGFSYRDAGLGAIENAQYTPEDVLNRSRRISEDSVRERANNNLGRIGRGEDIPSDSVLAQKGGFFSDFLNGVSGDLTRVIVIVIAIIMISIALFSLVLPGVESGVNSAVKVAKLAA